LSAYNVDAITATAISAIYLGAEDTNMMKGACDIFVGRVSVSLEVETSEAKVINHKRGERERARAAARNHEERERDRERERLRERE